MSDENLIVETVKYMGEILSEAKKAPRTVIPPVESKEINASALPISTREFESVLRAQISFKSLRFTYGPNKQSSGKAVLVISISHDDKIKSADIYMVTEKEIYGPYKDLYVADKEMGEVLEKFSFDGHIDGNYTGSAKGNLISCHEGYKFRGISLFVKTSIRNGKIAPSTIEYLVDNETVSRKSKVIKKFKDSIEYFNKK